MWRMLRINAMLMETKKFQVVVMSTVRTRLFGEGRAGGLCVRRAIRRQKCQGRKVTLVRAEMCPTINTDFAINEFWNDGGGLKHRLTPEVLHSREARMSGEQGGSKVAAQQQLELLTTEELGERLRLPSTWIREQTRSRALDGDPIPHLRFGRYIRFRWGSPELDAWLRRRLCSGKQCTSQPVC